MQIQDENSSSSMTIDDLPSPGVRWVASRKVQIVDAIKDGRISREEVLARYSMSQHELELWEKGLENGSKHEIMVTKIQNHRRR